MKKFYKLASVKIQEQGFVVCLDEKILKTPLGQTLVSPTKDLGELIAAEWNNQSDLIDHAKMPLTSLLNTTIDKVLNHRTDLTDQLLRFAQSDLICYYAEYPKALVDAQHKAWKVVHDWLSEHGVIFKTTQGISFVDQSDQALQQIEKLISQLDPYQFTVLQACVPILGSVGMGLMLVHKALSAEQAFSAATIDVSFQAQQWGEDPLEKEKRLAQFKELEAIENFLNACL